jgi:hypothetical protein
MSQPYHTFQQDLPPSVQSQPQHPSLAPNPTILSREILGSDELQDQLRRTGQDILRLIDEQTKAVHAGRIQHAVNLSSQCEQEIAGYKRTSESLVSGLETRRDAAVALLQGSSPTPSNINTHSMQQHTTRYTAENQNRTWATGHPSGLNTNSRNEGAASAMLITQRQTVNTTPSAPSQSVSSGSRQRPAPSRINLQATVAEESVGGTNVTAFTGPQAGESAETNVDWPPVTRTLVWRNMGQRYTAQVKSVEILRNP